MIRNEDTYCIVPHKIVRELGACEAIVFSTIIGLLRKSDGIGEIGNSTLMDMCGINNKMSLFRYINKLIESGYIEKRSGDGRGNISIYYVTEKGNNLLPFSEKKGNKNIPERVTKIYEKGNNLLPINKGINKELKESDGDTREAQSPSLSTTTTFFEENNFNNQNQNTMEDFNEFWSLYPGDPEWSHEKEACERAWYSMQQSWRDNLVQQLRQGKRWRKRDQDNPVFYIKNYNGEQPVGELPFVKQGTIIFGHWIDEAERNGKDVCVMRYNGSIVYCLADDKQQMLDAGAVFIRNHVPYKD